MKILSREKKWGIWKIKIYWIIVEWTLNRKNQHIKVCIKSSGSWKEVYYKSRNDCLKMLQHKRNENSF